MADYDPTASLREITAAWRAVEAHLRALRERIEGPIRAVEAMNEEFEAPRRLFEAMTDQLGAPRRALEAMQGQLDAQTRSVDPELHGADTAWQEIARLLAAPLAQAQAAIEGISQIHDLAALEDWKTCYLGRRGELLGALSRLGGIAPEHRREAGQPLNAAKNVLEQAYEVERAVLARAELRRQLERERVDVTLPGRPLPRGYSHPTITVIQEICELFRRIGFQIIEGPEVEWEHYNFTKLNIPPDHPARDLTDTFWITDKMLLRTHTSPNQIRAMERVGQPPIRVLVPGRCYRNEATDASHESTFFQIEGLMVDDRTTMADMKGVLTYMARGLFGQDKRTRFRCDYFPFVEPGAEMSVSCGQCDGAGCRMCKHTGWLEILGCGMVHPDVLRGVNIDPGKYSGWAFGLGVERIAILKYGIDDIRLFQQNDVRFLRQVG